MKICKDCNVEMLDNGELKGQHPFEIGVEGESDISVTIPSPEKGAFFGIKYNKSIEKRVKVRVCPKCGKLELYIEINKE